MFGDFLDRFSPTFWSHFRSKLCLFAREGITEVLDRFDKVDFTCEYKYDGERAQVHLTEDRTVKIFSRSSLDDTHKFTGKITSKSRESTIALSFSEMDCL